MVLPLFFFLAATLPFSENSLKTALGEREGTWVVIDCATQKSQVFNSKLSTEKVAPCSTFKIWNTAIGLETGILSSADQSFYKWDGTKREIEAWNKDLTLREAYAASCVPAYQALARKSDLSE